MSEPGLGDAAGGAKRSAEWYADNPQAKISFSRLATFQRCPAWYRFQYLDWHRSGSPPVTRSGHAVQQVFEKVVDLEPGVDATPDDFIERAFARARVLFGREWKRQQEEFAADPNGIGEWDLSYPRYEGYLHQALNWHGDEILARLEGRHPRSGEPLDLPPLPSVRDAWIDVRPWHVPVGSSPLAGMETVPAGFFQGQYDLVYTWTGGRRLVDLKASGGGSPFSTEIAVQLLAYTYIERRLGRDVPEGLEAWFLGKEAPLILPVPDDAALDAFESEVRALIERSASETDGFGGWEPEDFPAAPAAVEGHSPAPGEPSAWCGFCPSAWTCERSARVAPPVGEGPDFTGEDDLSTAREVCLEGVIVGVGEERERRGVPKRRFTLANQSGVRSLTWEAPIMNRLIEQGLRAGRQVRIEGVKPWRSRSGFFTYFPAPQARLEVLASSWEGGAAG